MEYSFYKKEDLAESRRLLEEVFRGSDFLKDDAFLKWQYHDNPFGMVVALNAKDEQGILGHYAVIPREFVFGPERSSRMAYLSLNTAVHERGRGKGLFTELADRVYKHLKDSSVPFVIGVPNDNVVRAMKRMGWHVFGKLTAKVIPSALFKDKSIRCYKATAEWLQSREFSDFFRKIKTPAPKENVYSPLLSEEFLRWRLKNPLLEYVIYENEDGAVICARKKFSYIPLLFVVQTLSFGRSGTARLTCLLRKACRAEGLLAAVYIGFNAATSVRGVNIPDFLRPSPLNLGIYPLTESPGAAQISAFEVFDFDVL